MFDAFQLSLRQLGDRAVLAVLAKSLAVTALVFAALGGVYWWGLEAALARFGSGSSGGSGGSGGSGIGAAVAVVLALFSAWLLFRIVAIAVIGLFADDVVVAVERRHYPAMLAKARAVPFHRAAAMGVRSGLRAALINLLLLPVYLAALVAGIVGAPLIFIAANAWLLGRDLGDMVAVRHLAADASRDWRRRTRGGRLALGTIVALLFLIPVIGLIAPVLGAAMATHLFHRSRQ